MGRIGFDHVAGFLKGGMRGLHATPELIRRTDRITAGTLAEQLMTNKPPQVLDVRTDQERKEGGIEPSLHIPLNHLAERIHAVPRDRTIVVYCQSGYRSSIAASLLEQQGISRVVDLIGGFEAWQKIWGAPCAIYCLGNKALEESSGEPHDRVDSLMLDARCLEPHRFSKIGILKAVEQPSPGVN